MGLNPSIENFWLHHCDIRNVVSFACRNSIFTFRAQIKSLRLFDPHRLNMLHCDTFILFYSDTEENCGSSKQRFVFEPPYILMLVLMMSVDDSSCR